MYSQPWTAKSGLQANSKWPGRARCAGGSCRKACEAGAPVDGVCDGGHLCQAHHVLQAQVLDVWLAHADELAQHCHACAAAMFNCFDCSNVKQPSHRSGQGWDGSNSQNSGSGMRAAPAHARSGIAPCIKTGPVLLCIWHHHISKAMQLRAHSRVSCTPMYQYPCKVARPL